MDFEDPNDLMVVPDMSGNFNSKFESVQNIFMDKVPMKKRILIVDDEPFNVVSMQLSLGRLGIKGLSSIVDRAYNGHEGL